MEPFVIWHVSLTYHKMGKRIHIGTSGWSYKHWKHVYYPARLPSTQWLRFHSGNFETTEINSSFYSLPAQKTIENWISMVPQNFSFSVKMSRYLTHLKKLRDPEQALERFFEVFSPMKNRMGPVLIQLPPMLKFNYDVTAHFYAVLRNQYRDYNFVFEVRHASWLEQDSLYLMSQYDIGLVISQSGFEFPYSERVTARNIYIRFHGPRELYASPYSDGQLQYFASLFKNWEKEGHEIWAYFNNDIDAHAINDARKLLKLCVWE